MKLHLKHLLGILFLSFSTFSLAQYNDFGVWNGLSLGQDLPNGFAASCGLNFRTNENSRDISSISADVGLKYNVNDWLKVLGGYRLNSKKSGDNEFSLRHRLTFDAVFDTEVEKFDLRYRVRYQTTDPNVMSDENDLFSRQLIRHRVTIKRKVVKKTVGWSTFEVFTTSGEITDWRVRLGVERKIKKRQYLTVGFQVHKELANYNPATKYILLVGYEIELKKRKKKKKLIGEDGFGGESNLKFR